MTVISPTVLLLVATATVCALGTSGRADVLTVQTDTSWKATAVTPGAGWATNPSYDDSAWGYAAFEGTTYTFPDGYAWNGIWSSTDSMPNDTVYFRKVFTIPGTPTSAFLDFGEDDDADLFLNTVMLINDHNFTADDFILDHVDVTSYLSPGDNLIAVEGLNSVGGAARIMGALVVTYVPEPASLALLGTAVAALLMRRRGRKA
jgi:hypothetical protein